MIIVDVNHTCDNKFGALALDVVISTVVVGTTSFSHGSLLQLSVSQQLEQQKLYKKH